MVRRNTQGMAYNYNTLAKLAHFRRYKSEVDSNEDKYFEELHTTFVVSLSLPVRV